MALFLSKLLFLFALFQMCSPLFATESQRLYKSAYFLGRGDTGIAIADGHEAIYYNPAGIAQGKGVYKETVLVSPMVEMSTASKDLARKVAIEDSVSPITLAEEMGKNQHVGVYNLSALVFRRAAFSVLGSGQVNLLTKLDPDQRGLPVVSASSYANTAIAFTLAEKFFSDGFTLGVTGKYILARTSAEASVALAEAENASDQFADSKLINAGSGGGADFGMMWRSSSKTAPVSLGVTVENAGDVAFTGLTPEDKVKPLKQTVNLGLAAEPGTQYTRMKVLLDVRDLAANEDSNRLKGIHLGFELAIRQLVGFSTGFNQGYATFGTYLNLYAIRFDLGMYTEEMGTQIKERPDQRFFFRLAVGF